MNVVPLGKLSKQKLEKKQQRATAREKGEREHETKNGHEV